MTIEPGGNYIFKTFIKSVFLACGFVSPVLAQVDIDGSSLEDDVIAIYGSACEKVKNDESKSTARVRVTDKASFMAVSDIADLSDFKKSLSEHDFNVVVYNIVDNLVEDMAVRTTSQTVEEICVELTGFVKKENLWQVIETDETINSLVYFEEDKNDAIAPDKALENKAAAVYVAPTEFYNKTKSEQFAKIIKDKLSYDRRFLLEDTSDAAKYVVYSRILRAKVDPINANTNRLQMVVSVELEDKQTKSSVTEHQNKFVLFSSDDDEQKVAYDLMKELLEKAFEPILKKLEKAESKGIVEREPLITPVGK